MLFLFFIITILGLSFSYNYVISIVLFTLIFLFFIFTKRKAAIKFLIVVTFLYAATSALSFYRVGPPDKNDFHGIVIEAKDNYFLLQERLNRYYVYDKDSKYEVGDVLSITANVSNIDSSGIESAFDFKDYLNKKGVIFSLSSPFIKVDFSSPLRVKEMKRNFLEKLPTSSRSIIKAILFSSIEEDETVSNISSLHLTRLLSSAGIYIALFYKIIVSLFSIFMKRKYAEVVGLVFVSIYNIFLFPKFAILRFLSMKIISYINSNFLNNKIGYLSRVAISGFSFILIDYHLTYQIGFILGYSFSIFNYFISITLSPYKKKKRLLLRYLLLFLFTIPIELYFYHEISLLGYLLAIILTPLFMLIALMGFISFIGIPLIPIMNNLVKILSRLTYYLSYINWTIYGPPYSSILLVMYYGIYILFLYNLEIKFIPIRNILFISQVFFICITLLPLDTLLSSEVSFISVGQGDSTLIRKGSTTVLIDTGGLSYIDIAKESLIPYLKKKKIYDIDLVITTHDDYDHVGALTSLEENFRVKKYIKDYQYFPITINGIKFTNYNVYGNEYTEENDKSLVIGFNLFSTSFLIMGDAPTAIEKRIMNDHKNIPCDILKVGHHGSNTSSSEAFVKYLSPKTAIISCGINNKFKHPHKEVLNVLKRNKVEIRRTDLEGTITYLSYFAF